MNARVIIYQQKLLGKIPEDDFKEIKELKPDYICLPEYFFHPDIISYYDAIEHMRYISKELDCTLIGGSTVLKENEKLYNSCYIFNKGKEIGHYRKVNLFEREADIITPGNEYKVFNVDDRAVGVLICADVLYDEAWGSLARLKPDIIFIPTFSRYKEESVEEKYIRDENIYVKGAKICNCPVVKVCSIGVYGDIRVQGRSLVAEKDGIIWRVDPDDENKPFIKMIKIKMREKAIDSWASPL